MFSDFLEDIRRPNIKEKPWMKEVELILGTTENIAQCVDECIKSEFYGCDIETTGLDSRVFEGRTVDSIVGLGLAPNENKAYYFPVGHTAGSEHNIPWSVFSREMKRLFHPDVKANPVFHNCSFDIEFLEFNGFYDIGNERWCDGSKFEDSFILKSLLNPREKHGRGLKALSKNLCDMEMIELNELIPDSKLKNYATLDPSWRPSVLYAGADPLCTLRIFNILYKEYTEAKGHILAIYKLEKSCTVSVRWMHRCRVHIDRERSLEFVKEGQSEWWNSLLEVYEGAKDILGRDVTPNYIKIMKGELNGEYKFDPNSYKEGHSYSEFLVEARKEAKRIYPESTQKITKTVACIGKEGEEEILFPFTYDINSPAQLGLLFRELKVPNIQVSDKGNIKTGAEVLDTLIEKSSKEFPFMMKMKKLRNFSKALTQYLIPFIEDVGKDGTLKPSFKQFSADTGRFSCKTTKQPKIKKDGGCRVPFQGIPATYDSSKPRIVNKMRKCIGVRDSENWLVAIDYAGVELRLVTNLSQEPKWIKAFYSCGNCDYEIEKVREDSGLAKPTPHYCPNCGSDNIGDLHTVTAVAFYGEEKKKDPRWKTFRGHGKQCNFALCYGGTGKAVQRSIEGCTEQEGIEKYKKFTSTYKSLTKFWANQHQLGRKQGFVTTAFGRVQPLPEINSDNFRFRSKDERKAVNGPIQGTSADITKLAMSLIYKLVKSRNWFDKVRMILTVHDEIVFEIHQSILKEAIELLCDIMARNKAIAGKQWAVPLLVDVEIGKQWDVPYDLKDIKARTAGEKVLKTMVCKSCNATGKFDGKCSECGSVEIKYKFSEKEREITKNEVENLYSVFEQEIPEEEIISETEEKIKKYKIEELTEEEARNLAKWLHENESNPIDILYEKRSIKALF